MTKLTKVIIAALIIVVLGVIVKLTTQKDDVTSFETITASTGTVTDVTEVSGNLRYLESRDMAFMTSGKIDRIEVVVGDAVSNGQMLALLRDYSDGQPQSELQKSMLRLVSPIDGVVTAVYAAPGEVVSAGMPIATVEGPRGQFEIVAQVSENDINEFFEGQDVTITVDAMGTQAFSGEVLSIAPSATAAQGIVAYEMVTSFVTDGKGIENLRAGMSVTVAAEESSTGIHVPSRAVLTKDGQKFVRVVDDATDVGYREENVKTGLRGDTGEVIITDGVEEGDVVVVRVNEE